FLSREEEKHRDDRRRAGRGSEAVNRKAAQGSQSVMNAAAPQDRATTPAAEAATRLVPARAPLRRRDDLERMSEGSTALIGNEEIVNRQFVGALTAVGRKDKSVEESDGRFSGISIGNGEIGNRQF